LEARLVFSGEWIATPHIPPDHRGPKDDEFKKFADPANSPTILSLLGEICARQPKRLAFADNDGREITFGMFWHAIVRLAATIENISSTGPIGICLPSDSRYPVAVFACLAARRLSVLLDENYPTARNLEISRRANVKLLLGSLGQEGQSPSSDLDFLLQDVGFPEASSTDETITPVNDFENDAPAFILTTSGSEGHPKALVHSQRTMLHWVRTLHDAMHIKPPDTVLSVSSPSSLGGFTSLLTFPLSGASSQMFDVKASSFGGLFDCLAARPVTILRAAPSLLRAVCQHPEMAKPSMAKLRIVQTYGEPLLRSDVAALRKILSPTCLIRTTYGSTEASGLSWFAREDDEHDKVRVPTGTLMPDTKAAILDEKGNSCPPNEVGELVIASKYNALGEWIDGRLVHGRLEPDIENTDIRIFRTGDVARYSTDGVFVVLGRRDRMANVNGQRVELAEIETALRKITSVAAAEVICHDVNGSTKVTAFVVSPGGNSHVLPNSLRIELASMLPSFMIPARIVLLDKIPSLPGGKVDARALIRIANAQ
jgi:acyl-coenzyme A synthetase/AMP-(fatty) acid ligase